MSTNSLVNSKQTKVGKSDKGKIFVDLKSQLLVCEYGCTTQGWVTHRKNKNACSIRPKKKHTYLCMNLPAGGKSLSVKATEGSTIGATC